VVDDEPQHEIGGRLGRRGGEPEQVDVCVALRQVPERDHLDVREPLPDPVPQLGFEGGVPAKWDGDVDLQRGAAPRRGCCADRLGVTLAVRPQPAARPRLDRRVVHQ
jgi:hypothetical protein